MKPERPEQPRRKPRFRRERAARAEYMRDYRARARAAKAADDATPPADTVKAASEEASAPAAPPPHPPTPPQGMAPAEKERLLAEALTGTVEALADTAQLVWLDARAPHLGHERSALIGKLWAPLIAPYINEDTAKWIPLALATGGTANAFYAWAHEYRAWREAHPRAPEIRVVPRREGGAQ